MSSATPRFFARAIILVLVCLFLVSPFSPVAAQDGGGDPLRYNDQELGIAFDLLPDWIVQSQEERISAGSASDLSRIESGLLPESLVILIRLGTYSSLGVGSVSELSNKVRDLVLPGVAASEPVEISYEGATGYQTEFTVEDSTVTTRISLLLATDGRVAIVRGIAPSQGWASEYAPQLEQILASLRFTLSSSITVALDSIPDSDGGVLWHYQLGQRQQERQVIFGGVAIDQSSIVYIAAGPRGYLALNQADGSYNSLVGPIFASDNFTDVAVSPDARLYFSNANDSPSRRIMVLDRAGNMQETWGEGGDGAGQFAAGMPQTIAVSRTGDVWTASEGHTSAPVNRIYRFSKSGTLLATIDADTISEGLSNIHLDMDVSADRLYVAGQEGGVSVLSWSGEVVARGIAADYLDEAIPTSIGIGINGTFVVGTAHKGFVLMNNAGVLLDRFGYEYDTERGGAFQAAEYLAPSGVAVDVSGYVYFAETNPDSNFAQVQSISFTGEGNLLIAQRVPSVIEVQTGDEVAYQIGGDIAYGQTVYGIISNRSNPHDYRFRAEAGDRVTITMQDISPAQSLDTTLILLDINLNVLVTNDDIGPNNFEIKERDSAVQFEFSRSGTYIIRATRFGGDGQYQLTLTKNN